MPKESFLENAVKDMQQQKIAFDVIELLVGDLCRKQNADENDIPRYVGMQLKAYKDDGCVYHARPHVAIGMLAKQLQTEEDYIHGAGKSLATYKIERKQH